MSSCSLTFFVILIAYYFLDTFKIESNSLAGRFVGVSIIRPKNANQHFLVYKPFLLLPAIKIDKILSAPLANMKKNFKNWFKLHFLLQSKTLMFYD